MGFLVLKHKHLTHFINEKRKSSSKAKIKNKEKSVISKCGISCPYAMYTKHIARNVFFNIHMRSFHWLLDIFKQSTHTHTDQNAYLEWHSSWNSWFDKKKNIEIFNRFYFFSFNKLLSKLMIISNNRHIFDISTSSRSTSTWLNFKTNNQKKKLNYEQQSTEWWIYIGEKKNWWKLQIWLLLT